ENRFIIGPDYNNPANSITNADLAACDNDTGSSCTDTDIGFTSNSGALTLTWGTNILRIKDADAKFAPGGNVTVNQFNQSAGEFNGGSGAIDLNNGSLLLSGGSFTSTSGILTIERDFTKTAGTFNANGGTLTFDGGGAFNSTLACGGATFNLVIFSKGYDQWLNSGSVTINAGCVIPLGDNPISSAGPLTNNGQVIVGAGTWKIMHPYGGCPTCGYIQNAGADITIAGTIIDVDGGGLKLNGGTITSTTLTALQVMGDLDNNGNVLPSGLSVTLNGSGGMSSALTCGSASFGSVTISKTSDGYGNVPSVTVNSGCVIPLGNDPVSRMGNLINYGSLVVGTGTWDVGPPSPAACPTCGYVQKAGGSLSFQGTNITATLGGLKFDGGTISAPNLTTIAIGGNLDNNGNVLSDGLNLNVIGAGGAMSSTLICGAVSFNLVTITKTQDGGGNGAGVTIGSDCVIPLGNSATTVATTLTNNGAVTLGTGTWTMRSPSTIWACDGCGYVQNAGASLTTLGTALDMDNGGMVLNGGTLSGGALTSIIVDGNFNNSGNVLPNGLNLTVTSWTVWGTTSSVLTCGTATFSSINISKDGTGATSFAGDCAATGNLTRTDGIVADSAAPYKVSMSGDFSMSTADAFGGPNLTLEFTGSNTQTFTQNAGTITDPVIINKDAGSVTLASSATVGSMTVTKGTLDQGASYSLTAAGVTIAALGAWTNNGSGNITLSGNVTNAGAVTINGSGADCGQSDISITAASPVAWSGEGTFSLSDVALTNQTADVAITVYSGTNVSGNSGSWSFYGCGGNLSQADYRWYENADAATPTNALAALNGPASVGSNESVRLRMNIKAGSEAMALGSEKFFLQYSTDTAGPWTNVTGLDAWWNPAWLARKKITLDNSAASGSLTDFPVEISLDSNRIDYAKTKIGGADLRFVDSDGSTTLDYEIEKWDSAGTSAVWVKIPVLDNSGSDYIWMYYNNPDAADGQDASGVWNSYASVYHMPDGATLSGADSVGNNNLTNSGVTAAAGIADGGGNFGGSAYMTKASPANLPLGSAGTVTAWIKPTAYADSNWNGVASWGSRGCSGTYLATVRNTGRLSFSTWCYDFLPDTGPAAALNNWNLAAWVLNGTSITTYLNGQQAGTGTLGTMPSIVSGPLNIGATDNPGRYFQGGIDEVTISPAVRSADWIKAEYLNMTGTMNSYGSEESFNGWSFRNNPAVADGSTLPSAILASSEVAETYQESSPSQLNPALVPANSEGEYDFSLNPARVPTGTYYFRVIIEGNSPLPAYLNYPEISVTVVSQSLSQGTYRWYENEDQLQPTTALGEENGAASLPSGDAVRLRMNIGTVADLQAGTERFKLQYATDTAGPWTDVGNSSWWDQSYLNRRKITFDNSASAENLTDFPVMVSLDSTTINYAKTHNNGSDIRFIDPDGTQLKYEIEKWDTSGT
ncbi:MAG: DUF2341 domain-containing protein, partial [Candidatus Saccharibacteria bacterium]